MPNITNPDYIKYNGQSYGEMPKEIKNKISHRYLACNNLKQLLLDNSKKELLIGGKKKRSKKGSKKGTKRG